MAFGFLGDIVEGVADVFLPPKGSRGQTFGSAIGGAIGGPTGAAVGGAVGSGLSSGLSSATATGRQGQEAVSSPTASQSPSFAPESALSGGGLGTVYRPSYTAGFTPRLPGPVTSTGAGAAGGAIMDIIPDINISKFFGSSAVCATKPSGAPITIRPDGCITVSRKQQAKLKVLTQAIGLPAVANALNLSEGEVAALLLKNFPRRGKGITAAQLRNAKRVNRTIMSMAKQLQDACKTTTRRR